uniref:C2H2-type domain-containing protein n=1 Tax=Anopheles melas TaxID=34690 RepID=A0A182UJP2_9DIPT
MDVESSSVASAAPTTTPIGLGTTDGGYLCAVVKAERPEGTESPLSATEHSAADGMALAAAKARAFTDHLRLHNAESESAATAVASATFCCKICSKVLSSASSLDRHVLVHTGERPFNCKYCSLTFTTNGNMHRHMRTHKYPSGRDSFESDAGGVGTVGTGGGGSSSDGSGGGGHKAGRGRGGPPAGRHYRKKKEEEEVDEDEDADEEEDYRQPKKRKRALFDAGEQQQQQQQDEDDGEFEEGDEGLVGGGKRKATLGGERTAQQYRKVRTINNNLLEGSVVESGQRYCCPVCVRNDFGSMLSLEQHLDREHPTIPAKCRHCEIVFRSHKALNAHRCSNNNYQNITPGFKDLTFVDFSSEKFPLIAKNLCEQSIRTPVTSQKYECGRCYRAFPCSKTLSMHSADCCGAGSGERGAAHAGGRRRKRAPSESDSSDVSGSDVGSGYDGRGNHRALDEQQQQHQQRQQQHLEGHRPGHQGQQQQQQQQQQQHPVDLRREDFFANLDLQNRSSTVSEAPTTPSSLDKSFSSPVPALKQEPLASPTGAGATTTALPSYYSSNMALYHAHQQQQQQHQQMVDSGKDLADIQSILNVTKLGGGVIGRQLDGGSQTPLSGLLDAALLKDGAGSDSGMYAHSTGSRDEQEEAQDAFTAEFRRMKLRGQFPCRICTAVFPNLRALKGHNRTHVSAAGPGPYQCNMCRYVVSDKATLVRHMRTHNGDRPYECAICNYAFTTKANCERHLRNRHGQTTREDVKRAIIYHPSEDSSCDDPLKKLQLFNTPPLDGTYTPGTMLAGSGSGGGAAYQDELAEARSSTPLPSQQLKDMLMPPLPLSFVHHHHHHPLLDTSLLLQTPPSGGGGNGAGGAFGSSVAAKIQVKSLEKLNQLTPPQDEDDALDEDDDEGQEEEEEEEEQEQE